MPSVLQFVANCIKKFLFCIFPAELKQEKNETKITPENNDEVTVITLESMENTDNKHRTTQMNGGLTSRVIDVKSKIVEDEKLKAKSDDADKCNKCEVLCSKCVQNKDKDDKKKKEKEKTESSVKALNILASFTMAFIFIIIHLCIWITCVVNNL